jgi:ubiquinone/menaquinone biosynthesis C-methylase UbiE
MTTPPEQNYVMDPELMAEMVRLNGQGRMLTQSMGGVLPELSQQERVLLRDVLDLACGPGEWALDLAFESPDLHVVGVDISEIMIEYASAQAAANHLNARFKAMSVLKHPMPFDDSSFDLVNMRLVFAFMIPEWWPSLLAECMRLLRLGGLIRITEPERTLSNNAVFERYMSLWADSFYRDQRTFSPDGLHYGLLPMLKRLLKQAGYTNLQHVPYMIDVSVDVPDAHQAFFANCLALLQDGLPFLRRTARGPSELEELEQLSDQLRSLVNQEDFCAYWPLMTFLGHKPATP